MGVAKEVQRAFKSDPDTALDLVRGGLSGRQRRVVAMLDALLEETDGLVLLDPERAARVAEAALGLAWGGVENPRVFARACLVLGSAYGALRQYSAALRLFGRVRKLSDLPGELRASAAAREAVVCCQLMRWPQALRHADASVRMFESIKLDRPTDYCSLETALATRSHVGIEVFINAPELQTSLCDVIDNSVRILEGHQPRMSLLAVHHLGVVIATISFSGRMVVPRRLLRHVVGLVKKTQRSLLDLGMTRRSPAWANSRWLDGLLDALLSGSLTVSAERALREGRDCLETTQALQDAVAVTLDLQWWLLEEGSLGRAVQECRFIEAHVAEMGQYRPVLEAWIEGLRRRQFETALKDVFRQVRRIRSVRKPGSVKVESDMEPLGW